MAFLKRFLVGLVSFLLLSGTALAYSDVQYGYKHQKAIQALTERGVLQGYPDGLFRPEGNINRAEATKVLIRSQYSQEQVNQALDWHKQAGHRYAIFPDVPLSQWYSSYVELAYQNQVVQGYPDGTFKPGSAINVAEALKMILESRGADLSHSIFKPNKLLLVNPNDWFAPYFAYAYEHNLINQNKFYHPAEPISRGQFAEILYRLETLLNNGLPEFVADSVPTSSEYTITIPRLNIISLKVTFADIYNEKGALTLLKDGLGHYLSAPGEGKKMLLFGHSSSYGWDTSPYTRILRHINELQVGDKLYLNYHERGYVYEIFRTEIISADRDHELIEGQSSNELALYTCWPPNSITQRYVVYAKPVE